MFRRLGLLAGGRDVTVSAAASLVGCGPEQARHALAELASVHLIEEQNHEVFTLSDLMHAYAADLARQRRRVVESIGERA